MRSSKNIIIKAKECAYKMLYNENSGHDYYHCIRVKNIAIKIASKYDCDKNLIAISALLHDIDDEKIFGNNGHKHLIEFFNANDIDDNFRLKITAIIDFLSLDEKNDAVSIETKIVQDADNLDSLGAIGLARMFAFGGANGKVVYNGSNSDSFSHYYQRLVNLPNLMNTHYAKEETNERIKFMREFIKRFKLEINQG